MDWIVRLIGQNAANILEWGWQMKKPRIAARLYLSGSPTWTRTRDLRINSPSLYRLSYQGIDKTAMILSLRVSVKLD